MVSNNSSQEKQTWQDKRVVLVVDDDVEIGEFLSLVIAKKTPYQPLLVHTCQEALEATQHIKPSLFLLNDHVPMMTGIQLYDQLHMQKEFETVPMIIMCANLPQEEIQKRNIRTIDKPFEIADMLGIIEQSIA